MAHCLLHNTRNMVHQEHSVDSKLRCSTVKFCTKYTDISISKQVGWKGKKTDKMYFQENVFLRLEYNSLSLFVLYRHLFVVVCLLKKNRYSEKLLLPGNKSDTRVLEGKVHFRLQWEHQESLLPMSTCQCQCQHEDILKTRF